MNRTPLPERFPHPAPGRCIGRYQMLDSQRLDGDVQRHAKGREVVFCSIMHSYFSRIEILLYRALEQYGEELTDYVTDLFLYREYLNWRKDLKSFPPGIWHSVATSLASRNAPTERLLDFGECIYSGLVFSYIEAPDYAESKMLMVQFTVAKAMWHRIIWHCPERS